MTAADLSESTAFDVIIAELRMNVSKVVELHRSEIEKARVENESLKWNSEQPIWDENDISVERFRSLSRQITPLNHEQDLVSELTKTSVAGLGNVSSIGSQERSADAGRELPQMSLTQPTLTQQFTSHRSIFSSPSAQFRTRSPWMFDPSMHKINIFSRVMEEKSNFREGVSGFVPASIIEMKRTESASMMHYWFILHPDAKVLAIWMSVCLSFLLYDIIVQPISLCFQHQLFSSSVDLSFDIASACVWSADMVFIFFTGVHRRRGLVMRPTEIARIYMKHWFIFDLILLIPDYLSVISRLSSNNSADAVSVSRFARIRRFARVIRFSRFFRLGKKFRVQKGQAYFNLVHGWFISSLVFVLLVHLISCIWYALGNSIDGGWVGENNLESASVSQAYAIAMHWSFSRMHGLASPYVVESTSELVLESLLIYLSLILVSCYTSLVVSVFMARVHSNSWRLWNLSAAYARRHMISAGLNTRLFRFLESLSEAGPREIDRDEQLLLQQLPKSLRQDLMFEAQAHFLMVNRFLKDLYWVSSQVVFRICITATQCQIFLEGEEVFAHGDECHWMFFVTGGHLSYLLFDTTSQSVKKRLRQSTRDMMESPSTKGTSTDLQAGSSISEAALWTEWTHVWHLIALLDSTTLTLDTLGFADAFSKHTTPEMHAIKYARCFVRCLNLMDDPDDLAAFDDDLRIEDLDDDQEQAEKLGDIHAHFMFLSHYKVEAGTEATLIRDHVMHILTQDRSHPAHDVYSPIFIDSEDLTDLKELRQHVKMTNALLLLLSPGVLLRPWCLVELVTAVSENVSIVPVEIQRPGLQYRYPDEAFYAELLAGKFLPEESVDLLQSEGITLHDVELAIRHAFLKIALPFSPHKSKNVREAELNDILKRCSGNVDFDSYTVDVTL